MEFHAKHVNSQTMGLPVYNTVGNHDLVKGEYGEKMYEDLFGPVYYSFNYGNVHFIVTPMPSGDYKRNNTLKDIFQWLKNDLAQVPAGTPLVMFNHDLLLSKDGFRFTSEGETLDLEALGLKAWIYGHWHNNFYQTHANTSVVSACTNPPNKGGIDKTIASFRIFDMEKNGDFTTELVHSYLDHELSIASPAPRTRLNRDGELTVMVNAYNSTAPVTGVQYKLGEDKYKPLTQSGNWAWTETVEISKKNRRMDSLHISVLGSYADGREVEKSKAFQLIEDTDSERHDALLNSQGSRTENDFVLNWVSNLGSNVYQSSPVIGQGKVFLATFNDSDNLHSFVAAYDLISGEQVWKSRTRNSVKQNVAFSDGKVLALDQIGYLYAFDAETGGVVWELDMGTGGQPGYVRGLVVDEGVMYTGDGLEFSAVAIATGERIWQNKKWNKREGGPTCPAVGGGVVLASSNWNQLFAFDQAGGEPLWANSEGGLRFRHSTPVYHEGYFYTTSVKSIFKLNPKTGEIVASKETDFELTSSSTPLIQGERLIVGSADAGVLAFSLDGFELVWQTEVGASKTASIAYKAHGGQTVEGSVVYNEGKLYFGALDGKFYCLDAQTGKILKSIELGAPIYSSASVTEGEIYISDLAGNLYCFHK